jgi:hypothetical protein
MCRVRDRRSPSPPHRHTGNSVPLNEVPVANGPKLVFFGVVAGRREISQNVGDLRVVRHTKDAAIRDSVTLATLTC